MGKCKKCGKDFSFPTYTPKWVTIEHRSDGGYVMKKTDTLIPICPHCLTPIYEESENV